MFFELNLKNAFFSVFWVPIPLTFLRTVDRVSLPKLSEVLITIILLMAIAYSLAIFQGTQNQKRQVQKYVSRRKEQSQKYRRRSIFGMGQDGEQWINYLAQHSASVQQLMKLSRNKRRFYQQGIQAATLIGYIS